MTDLNVLLIEAVRQGDLEEIQRLIAAGADANAETPEGRDIEYAAWYHRNDATDKDVRPENWKSVEALLDDARMTREERALHSACEAGDTEAVARHIAANVNLNAIGARFQTPMMKAAIKGHATVVAMLIEAGADPGLGDEDLKTAYEHACDHQAHAVAELFRKYAAQVDNPISTVGNLRWPCPFCGRWGRFGEAEDRCEHYLATAGPDDEDLQASPLFDGSFGELTKWVLEDSGEVEFEAVLAGVSPSTKELLELIDERGRRYFTEDERVVDQWVEIDESLGTWSYWDYFTEDARGFARSLNEEATIALEELHSVLRQVRPGRRRGSSDNAQPGDRSAAADLPPAPSEAWAVRQERGDAPQDARHSVGTQDGDWREQGTEPLRPGSWSTTHYMVLRRPGHCAECGKRINRGRKRPELVIVSPLFGQLWHPGCAPTDIKADADENRRKWGVSDTPPAAREPIPDEWGE